LERQTKAIFMTHDSFQTKSATTQLGHDLPNSLFSSLRLTQNFGESLGVKKVLATVPVGRPSKDRFFRTHTSQSWVFPTCILENKAAGETYVVSPEVASVLGDLVRPVELYAVIDRQNNPSLISIPLPGPNGVRNPWHESLIQAVERAKSVWLRISANKDVGGYDIYEATAKLPDPVWPDTTMDELLETAFWGRIITDPDHPVVQDRMGRV
jgi:hypothetical protein